MFFVDKWVHSNSLINVQPEENGMSSYGNTIPRNFDVWFGMLRKTNYPTVIPSHGILLSGMLRKTFRIDELQCCSDVEVLVCKAVKKMFKCWRPKKKSAWTDLDRVDFEKFLQIVNVQIEKSAWTGLGKNKKASSAASVFKFLQDWSPGGRRMRSALRWPALDKRCSSCYTLRGCGFADIQSREELKMLLQAKRQPG